MGFYQQSLSTAARSPRGSRQVTVGRIDTPLLTYEEDK